MASYNTTRKVCVSIRIQLSDKYFSFRFCEIKNHADVDVLEEIKTSDNSIQRIGDTFAWKMLNNAEGIYHKQPKSNSTLAGEMLNITASIHDQQPKFNSSFDAMQ